MTENEKKSILLGEFHYFRIEICPICESKEDIYNVIDATTIRCKVCKAKFKIEKPNFTEFPMVKQKLTFISFSCKRCGISIDKRDSYCEKCNREDIFSKIKTMENLQEKLGIDEKIELDIEDIIGSQNKNETPKIINVNEGNLIGMANLMDISCGICGSYEDYYAELSEEVICSNCSSLFISQKPDFSRFPLLRIPLLFKHFVCRDCNETKVDSQFKVCSKCVKIRDKELEDEYKKLKTELINRIESHKL